MEALYRNKCQVFWALTSTISEVETRIEPQTELRNMQEHEVYSIIGTEGFSRLVAAFYRQVPQDDLLGPMYASRDLEGAEKRLRDFLIYRFGGPQDYIEQRGHPRLRARHFPFQITQSARDRWMRLMNEALAEAALPVEAEQILQNFFDGMSTFMINRTEP
jgi:hemoglobin